MKLTRKRTLGDGEEEEEEEEKQRGAVVSKVTDSDKSASGYFSCTSIPDTLLLAEKADNATTTTRHTVAPSRHGRGRLIGDDRRYLNVAFGLQSLQVIMFTAIYFSSDFSTA